MASADLLDRRSVRVRLAYGGRILAGTLLFGALDWLLGAGLAAGAIRFPSSVAGMLFIFVLLSGGQVVVPEVTARLAAFLTPAVRFLTRWLALFFVPPLVMLPLAPVPAGRDLAGVLVVMGGGFVFTLLTTALLARLLTGRTHAVEPVHTLPGRRWPVPFILGGWAGIACGSGLIAWGTEMPWARFGFGLGLTVAAFTAGAWIQQQLAARLPSGWNVLACRGVVSLFHPVVFGALVAIGGWAAVGFSFEQYLMPEAVGFGPGDLLMVLLEPAVVALGVLLYEQRALLRAYAAPMLGTLTMAALLALFSSALGARVLGLAPAHALALIPRSVTTPIAIPIAELLGANPGITAAIVVVTGVLGAVFGTAMLEALHLRGAAVVGMAVGASSHGIGTAALVPDDPPEAAVSGVSFALMAALSTVAASISPIQTALLWIVGVG